MEKVSLKSLSEQIQALHSQIEALTARIAQIEGFGAKPAPQPAPLSPAAAPAAGDGITEELLMTIAAAVSAYLGKRAPIRQVRLVSSHAWAQQGRAFIQASHHIEKRQD